MTLPDTPHHVLIIDGHALAYRSYHALPPLTNARGESVHALIGFMTVVLRSLRQPRTQVIVTFDAPGPSFRHALHPAYKAGRAATPDDFRPQLQAARAACEALGLQVLSVPGVEADDVIATVTTRARAQGLSVTILTSDRDTYQLIGEGVTVQGGGGAEHTAQSVLEKYGVTPEQWVEFRALTGDASDNLPGASGIGPKTAAKLIALYHTAEGALAAAGRGEVPGKVGERLQASAENVRLSHEMSVLRRDVDVDVTFTLKRQSQENGVEHVLRHAGAGRLADEFARAGFGGAAAGPPASEHAGPEHAGPEHTGPEGTGPEHTARTVPEQAQQGEAAPLPAAASWPQPSEEDDIWAVTFSRPDDLTATITGAAHLRAHHLTAAPLQEPEDREVQTDLFGQVAPPAKGKGKSTQDSPATVDVRSLSHLHGRTLNAVNAKSVAAYLRAHGTEVNPGSDPVLHAHLVDANITSAEDATRRFLGRGYPADPAEQVIVTRQLLRHLQHHHPLSEAQQRLMDDIERPLSGVLARMEAAGVRLDVPFLHGLSDALAGRLATLESEIHEQAGEEFSIGSTKQLERVLFDNLNLRSVIKTKTQRSTRSAALEAISGDHPIVALLLEWRELTKLKGTYLDPLPRLVHPLTGRVHTTFTQTAVSTGRLSSVNPNLQNIPARSAIGREIRRGFTTDPGMVLISADYSQIELRILAHMAGDAAMQRAFQSGADIHRATAARMLGVPEDRVSSDQRSHAKTVNFGVLYGMGAPRLAKTLGVSMRQAQQFIDAYFAAYPGIRAYIERTLAHGREHGYVETLYGRRRPVPELKASRRDVREAGERLAYNMPIQGTAADIMKIAMIRLEPALAPLGARMLLQVHDEILVEAPEQRAEETRDTVRNVMEEAATLDVPLLVESGVGKTWYDSK